MKNRVLWWCMWGVGSLFWVTIIIHIVGASGDTATIKTNPDASVYDSAQTTAFAESSAVSISLQTDTLIEDGLNEDTDNSTKGGAKEDCINVNTAKVDDFLMLQGIGPVLAQRIVEFRTANGDYRSASDLVKVKGIGEGKLKKIRDRICF